MSVFDTLARLTGSGGRLRERVTAELLRCYRSIAANALRLRAYAELAPQPSSAEALVDLAISEEGLRERLKEALTGSGAIVPALRPDPDGAAPVNHWARLVQCLEQHQATVEMLRNAVREHGDALPATSQLFEELRDTEAMHCERLRALIARADPQALN